MRIAYFNANLRVGQDGVTRCVYKMIEGAGERGHDVIAITATLPDTPPIIPMMCVPSVPLFLQKNYRLALPSYHTFSKALDRFKPDILHINSPCTLGFSAAKYASHFRVPIVATYHTHFPTYPRYYNLAKLEEVTWRLTRQLYNQLDRTFVPTRPILAELRDERVERLQYVPNGVDLSLFNPSRRSASWRKRFGNGEKPIVLFVSRLVWEKDLRVLAEAYQRLRARNTEFEMVIVGDGNAREEFEQMMPGAHFLGYQSGVTLAESFASSDIFVFPSTTETFGLVTLEAMASGLVPVAAGAGGACELIDHGTNGLLAAPLDGEDLARNLARVLVHPNYQKTLAANARLKAGEYAWGNVLNKLFDGYADVLQSRKQRHAA